MSTSGPIEAGGRQKIAIISATCRFPGSDSVEEFWTTLQNRENNFKTQLENDRCYGGNQVNFLKCPVSEFDAEFFNISPNKAVLLDPQQRLLMELTWEALEKACINPHSLRGSTTGVFVGACSIDYETVIAKSSLAGNREFHVGYISSSYGALSSHIAYFLGLKAKHATIDRGAASSLFTLAKACTSLERGECNLAVAAAVNLILSPRLGQTESTLGSCTWEKSSEGCGVVVLKRLSDAISDRDFILGVTSSIGICTDAADGKFGAVSQRSIEKAIWNAHLMAGIDAGEISYVEVQGNESNERVAIESVYGKNAKSDTFLGCVADSIGNAESAAGFASLIKILLCFKHEIIPSGFPTIWGKSNTKKRYAAINSFGFANECAHLILEEPPDTPTVRSQENDKKTHNILTLSANSSKALEKLVESYKTLLETTENDISDICFTANTCRAQLNHRAVMHGNTKDDILALIHNHKFLSGIGGKPKIAFLFSSHNSFRFNLLSKQFYESNLHFKEALDRCSDIFQQSRNYKYSLMELLWEEITPEERQKYLLPINFSVQYSLTELFKSFGISPDFVLGYSSGEFSAGYATGHLNLSGTLNFLLDICEEIYSGQKLTWISIATSKLIAEKLLSFFLEENIQIHPSDLKIFAVNSDDQVIIMSNSEETSNKFVKLCLEEDIEAKIISNTQFVLNFSQLSPNLFESLQKSMTNCNSSSSTYVSGCTGNILKSTELNHWKELCTQVVNFSEGFKTLWLQGCRIFIEIGNADLLRLSKLNISQTQAASCSWGCSLSSHEDNLSSLASLLSKLFVVGCNINWETWYQDFSPSKVHIPTYPFQRERFWPNNK